MKTMTPLLSTTLVLMVATSSPISEVDAISSGSLGGNITVITALANTSVSLPCDISLPNNHEKVTLILWYREDLGVPIYSIEVGNPKLISNGGGGLSLATSDVWSDEKWLGPRAQFRPDAFPAILRVHNVRGTDAGQYRCRVDFTEAPTRNTIVNLSVIVPPNPVVIFDETGTRRTTFVGPYLTGDSMTLVCDAFGGIPPPRLTWSRSGRLIDDSFTVLRNGTVRNEIQFRTIDRSFLHAEFTCTATNTNLSRPVTSTVHVDMNFAPVSVLIVNKGDQLVVGEPSDIVCRSSGSRPPAHITWYLDGKRIEGGTESASSDGNATVSILAFPPKMEHIGKRLLCKASNPLIKQSEIMDGMKLNIDYAPRVQLALGKSIVPSSIYEGGDVYFDCRVKSRPPPLRILWQQNGIELRHNTSEGIILTNQSLVLQRISRRRSGSYTCQAANEVGRGSSQNIFLNVKYVPVCLNEKPITLGVGKGEMVDVICAVSANPRGVQFDWTFNNSADFIRVPGKRALTVKNGTTSKLTYTPNTDKDYGTLMCSASNEVGRQRKPCIFHIILAVAPDPVENCTVINKSSETFHLQCTPGFDGGMAQSFVITVMDREHGDIVYNSTRQTQLESTSTHSKSSPLQDVFIQNLSAGHSYIATVTPINEKGMGQPTHVLVDTLQHPAVELTQAEGAAVDSSDVSDTSSASSSSSNSLDLMNDYLTDDWMVIITGIIGGCIGCVLLLAIVSLSMRRCYKSRSSNRSHKHNRNRDSNGLNNSDSSSDKGCYNDPTITSDNMILMTSGEIDSGDSVIRPASYNQQHTVSHMTHQHMHQCVHPSSGNIEDFNHPTQGASGFQHVTPGGASTIRKGILKHHQPGSTPSSNKIDSSYIQQDIKPDVTLSVSGEGNIPPMPSLPPKVKHNGAKTATSTLNSQECLDHMDNYDNCSTCVQQRHEFQGHIPPPLGSTMMVPACNSSSVYNHSDSVDPVTNCPPQPIQLGNEHLISHKQSLTKMRRKLPQINQNFRGSTFKDGDLKNATHHSSSRQQMGNTNNDTMMGSTSFLDSSCTLPRRTSREGLINGSSINNRVGGNSQSSINDVNTAPTGSCLGSESTDPLLQIPNELSAVLTLKRGAQLRGSSITSSPSPARNLGNVVKRGNSSTKVGNSGEENNTSSPLLQTALSLKKKRESIV